MIVGIPPFYNSNKHKMYYQIENGKLKWPTLEKHNIEVSEEAKDLILKLLNKNKDQRLGKQGDVAEVLAHPWFKKISIPDLIDKKIKPPYIPEIKGDEDTSNFDEKFMNLEVTESIISPDKQHLIK